MELQPDTIGLTGIRDIDGVRYTSYYNAEASDVWSMAGSFISDFIMDVVGNNKNFLLEILNSDDDEDEDDE